MDKILFLVEYYCMIFPTFVSEKLLVDRAFYLSIMPEFN